MLHLPVKKETKVHGGYLVDLLTSKVMGLQDFIIVRYLDKSLMMILCKSNKMFTEETGKPEQRIVL